MAVENLPKLPPDARAVHALIFMRVVTKAIGPGFHPDSPADDYVDTTTNQPLFTPDHARQLDADIERASTLLEAVGRDPYAIAGRVQRRLLGMPFPSND